MIFLIKYNRRLGKVIELETFPETERESAENARLNMELSLLRTPDINCEIVLLEAESENALRQTHRRYFENPEQIAST